MITSDFRHSPLPETNLPLALRTQSRVSIGTFSIPFALSCTTRLIELQGFTPFRLALVLVLILSNPHCGNENSISGRAELSFEREPGCAPCLLLGLARPEDTLGMLIAVKLGAIVTWQS